MSNELDAVTMFPLGVDHQALNVSRDRNPATCTVITIRCVKIYNDDLCFNMHLKEISLAV
jgi:hypothetical protein